MKPPLPSGTKPKAGKASRSRRWTKKDDALLGVMPDEQLAKRLGRSVLAVAVRRHLKRVSTRRRWRPLDDKLLGTLPDGEIARRLGCTRDA